MTTPMHDAFAKLLGDILGRRWFAARHAMAAQQDTSHSLESGAIPASEVANDAVAENREQNDEGRPPKRPAL